MSTVCVNNASLTSYHHHTCSYINNANLLCLWVGHNFHTFSLTLLFKIDMTLSTYDYGRILGNGKRELRNKNMNKINNEEPRPAMDWKCILVLLCLSPLSAHCSLYNIIYIWYPNNNRHYSYIQSSYFRVFHYPLPQDTHMYNKILR